MQYYKNLVSFWLNHPNKLANGLQFKVSLAPDPAALQLHLSSMVTTRASACANVIRDTERMCRFESGHGQASRAHRRSFSSFRTKAHHVHACSQLLAFGGMPPTCDGEIFRIRRMMTRSSGGTCSMSRAATARPPSSTPTAERSRARTRGPTAPMSSSAPPT